MLLAQSTTRDYIRADDRQVSVRAKMPPVSLMYARHVYKMKDEYTMHDMYADRYTSCGIQGIERVCASCVILGIRQIIASCVTQGMRQVCASRVTRH